MTTGDVLATEVRYRIGNKFTLAQIGPYLNWNLQLIEMAGSYTWDLSSPTTATPTLTTGVYALPNDCDLGKALFFQYTTADKMVVPRLTPDMVSTPDAATGTVRYNSYYIAQGTPPSPGSAIFQPGLNPGVALNLVYHKVAATLDHTAGTSVPWNVPYMDNLLVLFTEAEIEMTLGWSSWVAKEEMARMRLKEAILRFSSNRVYPGLFEQAQQQTAGKGV